MEAPVVQIELLAPVKIWRPAVQPEVVMPLLPSRHTPVPAPPATVPALINKVSVPAAPVKTGELPTLNEVLACSVVKMAVFGVVEPIAQGIAQVQPLSSAALRLFTCVVDATTNGDVPVATVDVSCPEKDPVVAVKPAAKLGVPLNVGEPSQLPLSVPPPFSVFGPLDDRPLLNVALEPNVTAPLKLWVPDQVLLSESKAMLLTWMPSTVHKSDPVEQLVPPAVVKVSL